MTAGLLVIPNQRPQFKLRSRGASYPYGEPVTSFGGHEKKLMEVQHFGSIPMNSRGLR